MGDAVGGSVGESVGELVGGVVGVSVGWTATTGASVGVPVGWGSKMVSSVLVASSDPFVTPPKYSSGESQDTSHESSKVTSFTV